MDTKPIELPLTAKIKAVLKENGGTMTSLNLIAEVIKIQHGLGSITGAIEDLIRNGEIALVHDTSIRLITKAG